MQHQKLVNKQLLSFSRLLSALAKRSKSSFNANSDVPVRDTKYEDSSLWL
jgi:hypothetical protein